MSIFDQGAWNTSGLLFLVQIKAYFGSCNKRILDYPLKIY